MGSDLAVAEGCPATWKLDICPQSSGTPLGQADCPHHPQPLAPHVAAPAISVCRWVRTTRACRLPHLPSLVVCQPPAFSLPTWGSTGSSQREASREAREGADRCLCSTLPYHLGNWQVRRPLPGN